MYSRNMFHIFCLVCFLIYGVKSRSGHDRRQSFCKGMRTPTVSVSASIVGRDCVPPSHVSSPHHMLMGVERHGITKIEMECVIKDAGFDKVQVCQAFRLEKEVEPEGTMEFPFLICMGLRKR